ncbi:MULTISPECIES: hypothetical protein [Methanobrevibacter]|uniref:hypothetical protein n=1 Tax=Methanobrevibacter TaxID=2172 RepID=UPI00084CB518|nr:MULTISPECIES: hypothetical protein [Methanobrevibacter]OEC97099.1 hypothetical protein A9505_06045 [Methanobrevibacter sp. A27]
MREYGCYFEVLLQMTLKKEASDLKLTDFNQCCPLMELLKKALQFQQQCYQKKITQNITQLLQWTTY